MKAPNSTAFIGRKAVELTAFIWHSSGGRCPPRRPPALKTSRPSNPRSPSSLLFFVSARTNKRHHHQRRVTEQLTKHWAPFKVLRQRYAGMRFEEQRQFHLPQKHKATVPDSALRVEMNNLEEQAFEAHEHRQDPGENGRRIEHFIGENEHLY